MRTPVVVLLALLSIVPTACGTGGSGTDAKAASGDDASGSADAKTSGTGDAPQVDGSGAGTDATGAPSSNASAGPAAGPNETAKDDSALVLELTFMLKGGGALDAATTTVLKKAAQERISKSSKMASPESKVTNARRVTVTVLLDQPTNSPKGLNVKMGLVGVEQQGKCPLFDLDQNFTMSGAKADSNKDVLELRSAAITALLDKLEVTAPTLKPKANCTTYKDKK